MQKLQV